MSSRSTDAVVRDLLSSALGRQIGPREHPRRVDEPEWDSLKHIEIVFMLEAELDVVFGADEMAELDGLDAIVRIVDGKRCATG
jgi:acyl carrier protein